LEIMPKVKTSLKTLFREQPSDKRKN